MDILEHEGMNPKIFVWTWKNHNSFLCIYVNIPLCKYFWIVKMDILLIIESL